MIKVTPSVIKVTPFDWVTLSKFRISSKKLIITYGKGIELKANHHIVLRSPVAGGLVCDVAYFQNFQKTFKIHQKYCFRDTYGKTVSH